MMKEESTKERNMIDKRKMKNKNNNWMGWRNNRSKLSNTIIFFYFLNIIFRRNDQATQTK
jgi:fibrillarin-like rRNA methylase